MRVFCTGFIVGAPCPALFAGDRMPPRSLLGAAKRLSRSRREPLSSALPAWRLHCPSASPAHRQFSIERTTEPIQPRALLKFPNVYSPKLAMTSPEIINYIDLTQNAPEEPAAPVDQYSPEGSSRKTHGSGESCVLRQTDLPEDIRSTENLEPDKLASRNQAPKLCFSLGYDCEKAELCVASLEAVSGSIEGDEEALSDCYIHGSLTTGSSKAEAQTALMKKMPHAIWEEALLFPLAALEKPEGMLTLTLKNCDRFSRHHIAGEIKLSLENVGAPLGVARWVDLKTPRKDLPEAETNTASGGEVLLSISYLPAASRLIVVLIKARDLPSSGLDDLLGKDMSVKVTLRHLSLKLKKKQTKRVKQKISPVWNEMIMFEVPHELLGDSSVELEMLCQYTTGGPYHVLGRCRLGLQSVGTERSHWQEMLNNPRRQIAMWHQLHQ